MKEAPKLWQIAMTEAYGENKEKWPAKTWRGLGAHQRRAFNALGAAFVELKVQQHLF